MTRSRNPTGSVDHRASRSVHGAQRRETDESGLPLAPDRPSCSPPPPLAPASRRRTDPTRLSSPPARPRPVGPIPNPGRTGDTPPATRQLT